MGVLISGVTRSAMGEAACPGNRFLGKVRVKGRVNEVEVYEVFEGDDGSSAAGKRGTAAAFEAGVRQYLAGELNRASASFRQVVAADPTDRVARWYLDRAEEIAAHGVSSSWSGVVGFETA